MGSEYDPLFAARKAVVDDLTSVQQLFARSAAPFTRSPWSWWAWAVILPAVALATRPLLAASGLREVVFAWCGAIIVGGAIEMWIVRTSGRSGGQASRTTLATWVLRSQANLSFVAAVLSALLLWWGHAEALPGLWLLVLGHSFLVLGGLAFPPFRRAGWIYQLAGLGALWPGQDGLLWFAAATALGNGVIGLAVQSSSRSRS